MYENCLSFCRIHNIQLKKGVKNESCYDYIIIQKYDKIENPLILLYLILC